MPEPTSPKTMALSKDVLSAVQNKLTTLNAKALKKGSTVKLNPGAAAAWSVNYTT